MRAYWILPNREQRDEILASDGKATVPLRQILDPKLRPQGFAHGVPAELLEKCGGKELEQILFAQRFPAWDGDRQLFAVFSPAGCDSSGRVVHLGLLFLLEPREQPRFELPYANLSREDQAYASPLLRRMRSHASADRWAQSVREVIEMPSGGRPATNVALERSAVRFHSLYDAGPGGLTLKPALWRKPLALSMVSLVLFAVLSVWLSARGCERNARASAQIGVLVWRSN